MPHCLLRSFVQVFRLIAQTTCRRAYVIVCLAFVFTVRRLLPAPRNSGTWLMYVLDHRRAGRPRKRTHRAVADFGRSSPCNCIGSDRFFSFGVRSDRIRAEGGQTSLQLAIARFIYRLWNWHCTDCTGS